MRITLLNMARQKGFEPPTFRLGVTSDSLFYVTSCT